MSPIDIRKTAAVAPTRQAAGTPHEARDHTAPATTARAPAPGIEIEMSGELASSGAPVDTDRVAEIRSALRDGTYPVVPARIADAIIAARLVLGGQA